jgi:hypothetical protein
MQTDATFILPTLTKWRKTKMLGYAEQVLATQQQMLTNTGKNILHYTLKKNRRHISMNHYPKGDRIDRQTGAQYFYHCHRENMDIEEHGHFHCFMRYKHIPKQIKPKSLDDWKENLDNPMTHIIAISMDRYGQPIRLFTVNRWVTSEIWYDAEHLPKFIKRYKMTLTDDPYWQILDQWIEAMLNLFSPQIIWLQNKRDAIMAHHQSLSPDKNIYEDHLIEELSEISIDLKNQVQWIINTP